MDLEEYREYGKAMVDYIADYLSSVRKRRVFPDVKPGYMRPLLPDSAPENGESFQDIFEDIERVIMPGVTHWQSPHMHAYFPALNSPASLLGDMLADGLGCLGFTWASSPACTELEIIVMDWLAKAIGLPEDFLHSASRGRGGGVIQTTASESTLIGLLAGRTQMFEIYRDKYDQVDEADLNTRLVGYTSDQAHSSVEKAGLIGLVKMRYIESDEHYSMRGEKLMEAVKRDRERGLVPFFVCATLGSTGCCAFDNLREIGEICTSESMWLHVDAAYAGTAFFCPEFRGWLEGVEHADSFAFNPSKWMMVHFDCTAMWVKNSERLHRTFNVDPLYLKHENTAETQYWGELMHWQIPLSKRFRALKLWFVLRNFGIKGLQKHIRQGVALAKEFEELVQNDNRFEIPAERHLGLVVFRIKGENELTESLLKKINSSGKLHCVPCSLKGKYVIRFTITSPRTTSDDIQKDWAFVQTMCSQLLNQSPSGRRHPLSMAEIRKKNPSFGTSLLLSNSPMIPKVMNGSYVAIFEAGDGLTELLDRNGILRIACKDSPVLQRRLKGLLKGRVRQYSLDSYIDVMVAESASKGERGAPRRTRNNSLSGRESTDEMEEEEIEEDGMNPPKGIWRCDKCGQKVAA